MEVKVEYFADIFLIAGAFAACFYCFVLSRRLKRFANMDHGVGNAISKLATQVDDLNKALNEAQSASNAVLGRLNSQSDSAYEVANRLELLIASMHDLDETNGAQKPVSALFVRKTNEMGEMS